MQMQNESATRPLANSRYSVWPRPFKKYFHEFPTEARIFAKRHEVTGFNRSPVW
jgi:hypothetical protein